MVIPPHWPQVEAVLPPLDSTDSTTQLVEPSLCREDRHKLYIWLVGAVVKTSRHAHPLGLKCLARAPVSLPHGAMMLGRSRGRYQSLLLSLCTCCRDAAGGLDSSSRTRSRRLRRAARLAATSLGDKQQSSSPVARAEVCVCRRSGSICLTPDNMCTGVFSPWSRSQSTGPNAEMAFPFVPGTPGVSSRMASGHRKWCYYYSTTPAMGLAIPPISRPGGLRGSFNGIDWTVWLHLRICS